MDKENRPNAGLSVLNRIMVGLLIVGLSTIFVLYSTDKLTANGFLNAICGLILTAIVLSKIINRPQKNSN